MATQNLTYNTPWTLIQTQNITSTVTSVSFSSVFSAAYTTYLVTFAGIQTGTNELFAAYVTPLEGVARACLTWSNINSSGLNNAQSVTYIPLAGGNTGDASYERISGYFYIYSPVSGGIYGGAFGFSSYSGSLAGPYMAYIGATIGIISGSGITFQCTDGFEIYQGTISIYGAQ